MAEVRRLHAAGLNDREVGERMGFHRVVIRKARARIGLAPNGCFRWTAEIIEGVLRRLADGEPRKSVAVSLDVSVQALTMALFKRVGGREYDTFHTRDRVARAWDLFAMGQPPRVVAAAVGVTLQHAYRYRKTMPRWWKRDTLKMAGLGDIGMRKAAVE